ncbi:hypothetical protein IJM86_01095 [bacterium]|nr:hypothetical protein [bacterium]
MKKIPNFENKEVNIEVDDTSIRIFSPLEEVKNFKIKSQSFDSISFSRMASQSEDVVGYLISFENRIDLSPEKNTDKTIGKINPEYGEYLLVLDQSYDYSNNSIKLKNGKIKNIEQKLKKTEEDSLIQEKEILEIRTYNASSDTIQA